LSKGFNYQLKFSVAESPRDGADVDIKSPVGGNPGGG